MDSDVTYEVYFYKYCPTCKHEDVDECEEPCNSCLEEPFNVESNLPVLWEAKR